MAKSPTKHDDDFSEEPAEVEPKAKKSKDAEPEVQPHTAAEPYPTGNPPDPMEEYYKAHPERKLAEEAAVAAEKEAAQVEKKEKK
jgi:hypothetical protein